MSIIESMVNTDTNFIIQNTMNSYTKLRHFLTTRSTSTQVLAMWLSNDRIHSYPRALPWPFIFVLRSNEAFISCTRVLPFGSAMLSYAQCSPVSLVSISPSQRTGSLTLYCNDQPRGLLSLLNYHQLLFSTIVDLGVTHSLTQSTLYEANAELLFRP